MFGTEHRDQYRTYLDASLSLGRMEKPSYSYGQSKTSSHTALPWPPMHRSSGDVTWAKKTWAPSGVPQGHYRPSSSTIGSTRCGCHSSRRSHEAACGDV